MVAKVKRTTYLLLVSSFALQTCIDSTQAVAAVHSVGDAQDDRHLSSNLTSTAYRISGPTEERMDFMSLSTFKELMACLDRSPFARPADKHELQASIAEIFEKDSTLKDSDHPMDFAAAEVLLKNQNIALSNEILEDLQSNLLHIWTEEGKDPHEVFMYCGLGTKNINIFSQRGFPMWAKYVSHHFKGVESDWLPAMLEELRQACTNSDNILKTMIIEFLCIQILEDYSRSIAGTVLRELL